MCAHLPFDVAYNVFQCDLEGFEDFCHPCGMHNPLITVIRQRLMNIQTWSNLGTLKSYFRNDML